MVVKVIIFRIAQGQESNAKLRLNIMHVDWALERVGDSFGYIAYGATWEEKPRTPDSFKIYSTY